ncbi:sensor histidine kinase [Rubrobacter naiadicus]|uniref:sensor histidine kinase n=1 Tax=Rubrobacter naiadicus TaxID=1392641 RepID=UPI00235E115F|nr:HAMP domain-containing sensor histidine kinase [Rubrobacter naiadicus]
MNLNRIKLRLTLGYVAVFALIVFFLMAIAVVGFSRELVIQQDALLTQEARHQAANLLGRGHRKTLAEGSDQYGWAALRTGGRVFARDRSAAGLGLPARPLAEKTLENGRVVSATVDAPRGQARVVSLPMRSSGRIVGVVQYARSLDEMHRTVRELVLVLLPLGIGALGLAALGGTYMAGRAVRPVREAFERQRTFIADASHELRTPLTLIRADTEVLYRGLEDSGDRELAADVLAETDRMDEMISDLLLVARLDAGKLPVERGSFELAPVIRDAVERFDRRAGSGGVRLEVDAPEDLVAGGDPTRTGQILAALLDNALVYTPRGGTVTVGARRRGGFVEITVRDTGPGIPNEHLPHVFDRFYRVDKARSRARGGAGLGLSIARDLARAQGGDLEATNAPEGGALLRLTLPAADVS